MRIVLSRLLEGGKRDEGGGHRAWKDWKEKEVTSWSFCLL